MRLRGPGGWCRPSLQWMQEEEREGCRQTVLDGDRGFAQFGQVELEGPGGGPQVRDLEPRKWTQQLVMVSSKVTDSEEIS